MKISKQTKFKYNFTNKDAIGQIEGFPLEVIERMIDYQVEQGNKPNVKVFQVFNQSDKNHFGFLWDLTKEKSRFWYEVIYYRNFDVFFEKYPKK